MKGYVATAFGNKDEARRVIRELRLAGHTVLGDWTYHTVEGEAPEDAEALLVAFAREDKHAVESSDFLLLLHDERAKGAYVELGIALGAGVQHVLVLGGDGKAPNQGPIFYVLPDVVHCDNVEDVLAYLYEQQEEEES